MTDGSSGPTLDEHVTAFLSGDPSLIEDPYPLYERLRTESPVYRREEMFLVSTHASVREALHSPTSFHAPKDRGMKLADRFALLSEPEVRYYEEFVAFERRYMSRTDGSTHRRLRAAAQKALTPRRVAALEESICRLTDEYLRELDGEAVDLMAFASRLPLLVIMEMLGAPYEDAERLKAWGDAVHAPFAQHPVEPSTIRDTWRRLEEYRAYAGELVERVRAARRHGDEPEGANLVGALLDAEADDRLDREELVAMFMLLLFAGHETTTNLIGNGTFALLADRGQWKRVCEDPTLIPSAVEEFLRHQSPVQLVSRDVASDVSLGGVDMPAGSGAVLMVGSANRDPERFTDPEGLDITRRPNDHLALGIGAHFCLGAPVARLEGRIVFERLVGTFPELELAADPADVEYQPHIVLRGIKSLPVIPCPRR
jgi:cytochrome P450